MKKILILAYDFPPYVSVGGLRPYAWYKYFHEFGIYPIVITRQWSNRHGNHLDYISAGESVYPIVDTSDNGTIIRTPYKPNLANRIILKYGDNKYVFFRKIISFYYELMQFFFSIGTKSQIYKEADRYLKSNAVDAIIATGDPFVLFKYASDLSRKYNIPWIADYRDPWLQNTKTKSNLVFYLMTQALEKKHTKTASCITTVSKYVVDEIRIHKTKPYHIVTNGYDYDIIEENYGSQDKEVFKIGYSGTIYYWHPIDIFIHVFFKFIEKIQSKAEIHFYGVNISVELRNSILKKYPYADKYVFFHPKVTTTELKLELQKCHLFLLFNDYIYPGTKIYNYLALKRQILFCFTQDKESLILAEKLLSTKKKHVENVQENIILSTQSGVCIKDQEHLFDTLNFYFKKFKQDGMVKCDSINQEIELHSRKGQTKKLSDIIKNIK